MRLHGQALWEEERAPIWFNAVALLISVAAGVTAFSTNSALHLPVGCCTAQGSRRSG